MARVCLACSHPDRKQIDTAIIEGSTNYRIASDVGVGEHVIRRHKKFHLLPTLNNARNAQEKLNAQAPADAVLKEARRPLDLLKECEGMLLIAKTLMARAAQDGRYSPAVSAVGEITRLLALLGRLQGDLDSGTTVNVQTNTVLVSPEWTALRGRILTALKPHPQALEGVLLALAEGSPPDTPSDARPSDAP